ncbi:hypothetical protein [Streptomyces sp. N2A]|uniref:hypothetical protein n=1 Tax=Streptomyces sp. N2A TaxID=3073936 RepID=UPI002870772C|nr:hypothetical protein [Streptomyces sp. N2A]
MSKAPDNASLVSAAVQSAFNIANSLGAYLGGLVISAGLGYTSPVWLGALLALAGLVLAVVLTATTRRGQAPVTQFVPQPQLNHRE